MKRIKITLSICFLAMIIITCIYNIFYEEPDIIASSTSNIVKKSSSALSIMLEDSYDSGMYEVSEVTSWPDISEYSFNETLSSCINGGVLSWDSSTNIVYFSGTSKDYCYIYFDYTPLLSEYIISLSSDDTDNGVWKSSLTNDGYRYVGTDVDNYICFGTTDIDECTENTDLYMYRVIGVFQDDNGEYHVKLIKKEALESTYAWNDSNSDVDWDESTLYNGLIGDYFLQNSTYSYMQDEEWLDLINDWTWLEVNTKSYEYYDKTGTYGLDYFHNTVQTIYYHESNLNSLISTCYFSSSDTGNNVAADCTSGSYSKLVSKISLIYASDYLLSTGNNYLSVFSKNIEATSSWMHIINNDSNISNENEWIMTRYSYKTDGNYRAYYVSSGGCITDDSAGTTNFITYTLSVRPTFYLNTDVKLTNGDGTFQKPYTIG